ncbi:unnamed protein product [Oikopleura dioica]|uniref:Uncharacterized protein n=1 Tax=Oikopleura dioica TaxID=34765 RepID=E4WT26_OIKDI|nr:unnamed protein product [Oikopleura dioica]
MKLLSSLLSAALGDIYLHFPRGSNNRLNEHSENRANANRLFDSENNNQGGYNVGDKTDVEAEDMDGQSKAVYFQSGSSPSELTLEWTNQHGCGRRDANDANWVDCSYTIQYMCQPAGGDFHTLQNGFDTDTATYTPPPMDMEGGQAYLDRMEYDKERALDKGVHESWHYYDNCFKRERNRGLFVADRSRNRDRGATRTRQNENGAQYGYECPEERDYYPYWHPSPWIDIAHLTSETAQCPEIFDNSGNRAAKNLCVQYYDDMDIKMPSMANNEEACLAASGTWTSFYNFQEIIDSISSEQQCIEKSGELGKVYGDDMIWAYPFISNDMLAPDEKCLILPPKVICEKAQYTRANHLGNTNNEKSPSFTWTLPNFYSEETRDCALRIRYNITTNDYPDEFDKRQTGTYFDILKLEDDPTVTMFDELTLQLAINTAQVSRVFQDRSHLFQIAPRPSEVDDDRKIVNVGVRGRRGNIVQAYPSVEYDFSPQNLEVSSEDLVHIQWEGSNTNPASDGEGREHTDRNNLGANCCSWSEHSLRRLRSRRRDVFVC